MTDGRRFTLRLRRNRLAREAALAEIAEVRGFWVARIGGPVRGEMRSFASRDAAVLAVTDHYNAALWRLMQADRARTGGTAHGEA